MENNVEFTGKKYDQDFINAAWGWESYRRLEESIVVREENSSKTKVALAYLLFFDEENYKVSVWKWKKFYHELVAKQREHKKNHEQSAISGTRVLLRFLLELRKYGKEQYKMSRALEETSKESIIV